MTSRGAKWCYIAISVLFCILGVWLIACPELSVITLCYIVGGLSLFYGVTKIFGFFSHDLYNLAFQFDLALGIFLAAIGAVLIAQPQDAVEFFQVIIGIVVLIEGVFKLQTSVDAQRFGLSNWWLILIGAILCIGFGLILVFDPFASAKVLMIFTGIAFLADGLQNLFNAVYTVRIIKRQKMTEPYYEHRKENEV